MKVGAPGSFGAQLKALRDAAGFTQEELATIAGLSVHAVSALERGERRRPHVDTVRALSAALDLTGPARDALLSSARTPAAHAAVDELIDVLLPLPLTALLGRDREMEMLTRWIAEPVARLITLVGPGGVGKTRLALETARAIANQGPTRVVFIALATIRDSSFVAPAIAEGLGLSDVAAVDLPRQFRATQGNRRTLLVLDNCEHVLDAVPLVADLLVASTSLHILATSRAPLRVRGEREYLVEPLALAAGVDAMSPADAARVPAMRLFVERARDVQPDFCLTPANVGTVGAICRRLDALPLALELAAPWIKVLTPRDLLQRLEHDVLFSTVGPRDLPERQRTVNATVAWSYQLLDSAEQRVFRRLGALPGRFSIEAAAAVLADREGSPINTDEALRSTARLIDRSLLLRAEAAFAPRPMYRMLETVRAYATLGLVAAGERDEALEGLAHHCHSEAGLAGKGLVGTEQVAWLHRVRDDLENYRSALGWFIEHGRSAQASDIAFQLMFFWLIRGHAAEGLRWYEQILNLRPLAPATESRALVAAAIMRYTKGELDQARSAIDRALPLARQAGDLNVIALADLLQGHLEHLAGNLPAACQRFIDSIENFQAVASPWGAGNALSGMAWVALAADDGKEAERLLDRASPSLRDAGPWFLALGLYVRASLAVRKGKADDAIALMAESLTSIRELQDKFAFVHALVPLASAAVLKGNHAWAARILGARDAVAERTGATVADNRAHELLATAEREARSHLGPDRWTRTYAAGQSASIDSLLKEIERARS